jgi:hypothetical protein
MVFSVGVEKSPNHSLVLGVVFPCLGLKEFDAAFAQGDRHFHPFFSKDQVLGTGKKVRNDFEVAERFVGVSDFLVHKFVFLCASNRRQKYGSRRRDK